MSTPVRITLIALAGTVAAAGLVAVGWFLPRPGNPVAATPPTDPPKADPPSREVPTAQKPTELHQKPAVKPYYYDGVEAVCVGIDYEGYPGAGAGVLAKAPDDARRFAETLQECYGIGPAKLLINAAATKKEILLALDELDARAHPPEAVILYFAGHGQSFTAKDPRAKSGAVVPLGYLIPHGATVNLSDTSHPEKWDAEAIDMRDLAARIDRMKARHVVLFVDACCSGYLTKRSGVLRPDVVRLLTEKSRTVVSATTQRQAAVEETTGGVFTTALVRVLQSSANGRDAHRVTDIHAKVYEEVTEKRMAKMSPQLRHLSDEDGEFVFIPKTVRPSDVERLRNEVERARRAKEPANPSETGGVLKGDQQRQSGKTQLVTLADVCKAMDAPDYRYSADPENGKAEWERMFKWFEAAASLGEAFGMAGLYFCHAKGLGTEKSAEKAYHWAQQAFQVENPAGVGAYYLARAYQNGIGTTKNETAAAVLYEKSAKAGFVLGELYQAELRLLTGPPKTQDELAALVKLLERGVAQKVAGAAFTLAGRYTTASNPEGKPNVARAIELYGKGADWGNTRCMMAAYEGLRESRPGSPKDVKRAAEYLRQAVAVGDPLARWALASECCSKPLGDRAFLGLNEDLELAVRLLNSLAEQAVPQSAMAKTRLSQFHEHGWGMPVNLTEAKRLCEEAAAANDMYALFIRGRWFATGTVYPQDFEKAAQSYAAAGDLGHPEGCWMAAQCFETKDKNTYWMKIVHYTTRAVQLGAKGSNGKTEDLLGDRVKKYLLNEPLRQELLAKRYPATAEELKRRYPGVMSK